ncbi:Tricarboxylate transport protein, mitochondrial [Tupaia chinensis]|uniref:Tricarboxylate transport protein, mitochondrial n=1 Tax=Tupaia chinensis TaxID=246437 RepID=L9KA08_TUPCH|nr:Tricarboxylate transport protein, mitochondrial [Tupaia chinensis]
METSITFPTEDVEMQLWLEGATDRLKSCLPGLYPTLSSHSRLHPQGSGQVQNVPVPQPAYTGPPETTGLYSRAAVRPRRCVAEAVVIKNTPSEMIKTQMQGLRAHKCRNTCHWSSQSLRDEGLKAFYQEGHTFLLG